jgi:predicted RND superfamily exporter protein
MKSWISFVIRFRFAVIALCLLLTAGFASQIPRLQILINSDNFIPQSNHYAVVGNEVERVFGNKHTAVIGITANSGSIYQPAILAKVSRITARLMASPGVVKTNVLSLSARKAKSITGVADGMEVRPLMEQVPATPDGLASLRHDVAANPAYRNILVSANGKTTQIVAEFHEIPGGMSAIAAAVQAAAAPERDASVDITVSGEPIFLAWLEKFSGRMGLFLPAALVIIGLVHWEAFRTLQALILPLVTAILAVIWSVSFLAISGSGLDVFNATTPILIMAIAAGHAVQILKRYYEEFAKLKDAAAGFDGQALNKKTMNRQAIVNAVGSVGPIMIAACVVAALGFLSLTVFEIKAIKTFGIFSALGVASALVLELTFIPALRAILPAPGEREYRRERQVSVWDRFVTALYGAATRRRTIVFVVAALAIAGLALGGTRLVVENSVKSLFRSVPVKVDDDKLNTRMAGTTTFYLLVDTGVADGIKNPAVLRAIEATQAHLAADPLVGKTLSIADFIKRMNQAMNGDQPGFYSLPADRNLVAQYLLLYASSGEPGDFDSYVDSDYRKAVIQVFYKSDDTLYLSRTAREVETFAARTFPAGVTARVGGGSISTLALTEEMVRTKLLNIAAIMLCVFLVTAVIFRSVAAGLLVLVPLVATVVVNFGVMGWLGIPMNIPNALVSAMAIGIGADYAIYLCFRLREELRTHHNEAEAERIAFQSAGKAALFVSTAVAGGFGVLMLSWDFYLHMWMGLLISLAMLVSSLSTLTLFASLLFSLRPTFIFRQAKPSIAKGLENAVS